MSQYLLATYSGEPAESTDAGPPMTPKQMQEFMQRVVALEAEMEEQGVFLFGGRLHGADTATVLRAGRGGPLMTDGPFVESKEHIAGFYIIEAADLDDALVWARRVVAAIDNPIEVRPFAATGKAADHMPGTPGE